MGEQKPEKTKKHICAGLLAHVPARWTKSPVWTNMPLLPHAGSKTLARLMQKQPGNPLKSGNFWSV